MKCINIQTIFNLFLIIWIIQYNLATLSYCFHFQIYIYVSVPIRQSENLNMWKIPICFIFNLILFILTLGLQCEEDINECDTYQPCANGICVNNEGKFFVIFTSSQLFSFFIIIIKFCRWL